MKKLSFVLNGEARTVMVDNSDILLEVLREKMGVKSPKCGCDTGDCGACTVLLNGRNVRSCLIFAVEVEDQEVTTLEGISKGGLTPLQKTLLEENAFQCGFCAPGFILTATELLNRNPNPDEAEIKEAVAGNLCRCTGYTSIIRAIKNVSNHTPQHQQTNKPA
ncbi:MAG: (2Fe-2S)-binding protein [Bacteroidales bacterium]|nr:(2Fe-2S)-binding protein [Bacteroidales bacterium]